MNGGIVADKISYGKGLLWILPRKQRTHVSLVVHLKNIWFGVGRLLSATENIRCQQSPGAQTNRVRPVQGLLGGPQQGSKGPFLTGMGNRIKQLLDRSNAVGQSLC